MGKHKRTSFNNFYDTETFMETHHASRCDVFKEEVAREWRPDIFGLISKMECFSLWIKEGWFCFQHGVSSKPEQDFQFRGFRSEKL